MEVRYRGTLLPYRTFDRLRRVDQALVVDNKRLGPALEWCRQQQALAGSAASLPQGTRPSGSAAQPDLLRRVTSVPVGAVAPPGVGSLR